MKKPVPIHATCRGFEAVGCVFLLAAVCLGFMLLDWLENATQIHNFWGLLALVGGVVAVPLFGLKLLMIMKDRADARRHAARVARWHAEQAAKAKQAERGAAASAPPSVPQPAAPQIPRRRTAEDLKRFDEEPSPTPASGPQRPVAVRPKVRRSTASA